MHAHTKSTMQGNNRNRGVMNDALVPTDPCRSMFKWIGLNLTIEMTGHSFGGRGMGQVTWMVCGNGNLGDWCLTRESSWIYKKDQGIPALSYMWEVPGLVVVSLNLACFILFTTWDATSTQPTKNDPIYHRLTFLSSEDDNVVWWDTSVKLPRAAMGDAVSYVSQLERNAACTSDCFFFFYPIISFDQQLSSVFLFSNGKNALIDGSKMRKCV